MPTERTPQLRNGHTTAAWCHLRSFRAGPGSKTGVAAAFANAVIAVLVRRYPGLRVGVDELAAAANTGLECAYDPEAGVWRLTPSRHRGSQRWLLQRSLRESSLSAMRRRCRLRGTGSASDWSAESGSSKKSLVNS